MQGVLRASRCSDARREPLVNQVFEQVYAARKAAGDVADGRSLIGSPSWTHIEPCASLRSRSFGGCSSKPETCRSPHRAIEKAAPPQHLSTMGLLPDVAFLE